nr:unnamed protein product [Callosobruchus chinensis]
MHDNTRTHTARITQQYLNDVDTDILEWPALSPDANTIEHIWDMLGRTIRSRVPIPLTLNIAARSFRGMEPFSSKKHS